MDTIQSAENVASLAATLDLARQFAGEVGGVPVEIVEASGQALGETSHDGGQTVVAQDEALEIMSSSLSVPSVAPSTMASGMSQVGPLASSNDMVQQLAAEGIAGTHAITLAGPPLPTADNNGGTITSTADLAARLGVTLDNNLEQQLQHVSQSAMQTFQEVSRSLRSEGIEISPEAIADSLAASITHSQATPSASSVLESAMSQSSRGLMGMNYSDLTDMTRVISSSVDPQLSSRGESDRSATAAAAMSQSSMESVLNESEVIPSSPESNFDTNDLLNNISHRDDLMSKLASTGPVGVAAAAAIVSSRKRKRHSFESNPALRKRHCSKLMRRLRETLDELSTRVGLQTCVVTYRPSAKTEKPDPVFKVFGTSPLIGAIENQKEQILTAMDESLRKQAPPISLPPQPKQALFELPPLVFDGIPTPINEMTQAQLRAFIPGMLKFSTGRGKPGWGKAEMRPSWWPDDIPWQNVRSDVRTDEQKKAMSWTDALRRILTTCYIHHGRTDLLTQFTSTSQQQHEDSITAEAEEQLRIIQQQSHELDLAALQHSVTSGREGGVEDVDPSLVENHQVFTIDTGMGNCDTTGMPTLADASLAETAARLQQVADETGQVQYATQTVTVTDRDAKALGQPVGSTTTVLLTAYPSGHGPPSGPPAATSSQPQLFPPASSSSSTAQAQASAVSTAPSVQVVYSASHVSELPDSIMSGIGSSSVSQDLYSQTDAVTSAVEAMDTTVTDSSDYLTSPQVMVARNDPCSIADLASQYINQYAGSLEPPGTDQLTATDPATPSQDI